MRTGCACPGRMRRWGRPSCPAASVTGKKVKKAT
jgi:hypothetical protein